MSFAPKRVRHTLSRALRRTRDDEPSWWDDWGPELGHALLEAAVLCAPVVAAGSFELYIAREKAKAKLELERVKALAARPEEE